MSGLTPTVGASSSAAVYVGVTIGGEAVVLPASRIRSVARVPKLTRVPHAPTALAGLANVEGSVLPIISLARLLDYPEVEPTRLIVFDGAIPCGLLVDEVGMAVNDAAAIDRVREIDERLTAMQSARAERIRPAARPTVSRNDASSAELALLCFMIGRQEFALPITQIVEVIRWSSTLAPLPGSDRVALGTIAHRGASLPVLSLAALLNVAGGQNGERQRVLVVRIGAYLAGFAVAAVNGVLRVPEERFDPVSPVLRRGAGEACIQAICRSVHGGGLISVLAAEHLVKGQFTAQPGRINEKSTVTDNVDGHAKNEQILAFRIGEEEFGLPVEAVEEVVRLPEKLTRCPGAPDFVEGLMNLRGEVLPVIDQSRRFHGSASASKSRRVVVARAGELRAGFIVDAVSEVLRVPVEELAPTPELSGSQVRLFERVASLDGGKRIILVVSPKELLDRAEREMLAKMVEASAARTS